MHNILRIGMQIVNCAKDFLNKVNSIMGCHHCCCNIFTEVSTGNVRGHVIGDIWEQLFRFKDLNNIFVF